MAEGPTPGSAATDGWSFSAVCTWGCRTQPDPKPKPKCVGLVRLGCPLVQSPPARQHLCGHLAFSLHMTMRIRIRTRTVGSRTIMRPPLSGGGWAATMVVLAVGSAAVVCLASAADAQPLAQHVFTVPDQTSLPPSCTIGAYRNPDQGVARWIAGCPGYSRWVGGGLFVGLSQLVGAGGGASSTQCYPPSPPARAMPRQNPEPNNHPRRRFLPMSLSDASLGTGVTGRPRPHALPAHMERSMACGHQPAQGRVPPATSVHTGPTRGQTSSSAPCRPSSMYVRARVRRGAEPPPSHQPQAFPSSATCPPLVFHWRGR
jgi:hypothetical protein